jgi:cytoskeletal protein CcmA (bactofilin family)
MSGICIEERTTVHGEIRGPGDVVVRGQVHGAIETTGAILIEPGAVVDAQIRCAALSVEGTLLGSVRATLSIHVRPGATVSAALRSPAIFVSGEACFDGSLDVEGTCAGPT